MPRKKQKTIKQREQGFTLFSYDALIMNQP